MGGAGSYEGRVEIFHDGAWGRICNNNWDMNDVIVVCRMLNYTAGIAVGTPGSFSAFDQGDGPAWMNNVNCTGQLLEDSCLISKLLIVQRHLSVCLSVCTSANSKITRDTVLKISSTIKKNPGSNVIYFSKISTEYIMTLKTMSYA